MYPQSFVDALVALAAHDGLLVLDPAGRQLAGNPLALSLLGRAPPDLQPALCAAIDQVAARAAGSDPAPVVVPLDPPDVRAPVRAEVTAVDAAGEGGGRWILVRVLDTSRGDAAASDRWQLAMDNAEDGLWDWDAVADRVFFSSRWKSMLGHADAEVGDTLAEWSGRVHPDDLGPTYAAIADHFEGRAAIYRSEHRVRHKDGSWRWVLDRGKVISRTADGKPARVVGSHTDITRFKEMEFRLREQAAALHAAQRLARVGSWALDPATGVVEWSAELAGLLGFGDAPLAPDEGQQQAALGPVAMARLSKAVSTALSGGDRFEIDLDLHPANARMHGVRVTGEVLRDEAGNALRVVGAMVDMTAAVQERERQRRAAQILERMSLLANVGGWELEAGAPAPRWTEQTYRIHGLPPGTAVPLGDAYHFYPADAEARIQQAVALAFAEGQPYDVELPFRDALGRERWVRVNCMPDSPAGPAARLYGAIQDITDRKRTELALQSAKEEAQRRAEDLSAFASVAAHDLKEPLRKVEFFMDAIAGRHGEQLDPQGRDYVQRAARAAGRMRVLIDDLLALARAGAGEVAHADVALDALLDDVLESLAVTVASTGARILREPLPVVEGDPTMLRQLLQNLVGNALKFRDPSRTHEVRIATAPAAADGSVAIVVEDNGIGFSPEQADRIMRPFERLHGKSRFEGTGLGLAIVSRVAERHGGHVRAEGRPGAGARFEVELPRRQPDAAARTRAFTPEPAAAKDVRGR